MVKQKKNPHLIPINGLNDAASLLAETIEDVSENATQLVKKHLETHQLGERSQTWLEYGTVHAPEDHCPYCGQETTDIPLVMAYRAYFSEAFKELKGRIDELWKVLNDLSAEKLDELIAANDVDFNYWSKLCEISTAPTLSSADRKIVVEALGTLKLLLEGKRQSPLENVSLGTDAAGIAHAISLLSQYNIDVAANTLAIDQARSSTSAGDLQKAESIYMKWLALGEKVNEPVKSAVADYIAAKTRLDGVQREKTAAQDTLKIYTSTTMAARQNAVNVLLSDFGASFRIVDTKTNFVGREPNTEFGIEIGAHKIKAGDKSDTEPSFKTVLSAGDKTTLALAFFIAQIEADPDINSSIVVFDDPFNSQDLDRQFQTTSHIRSICGKAGQTIVLSHDPRFLHLIERNADNDITRTFQLQCSDSGEGVLRGWFSADELKSLYVQQSEMIREYANHQNVLKEHTVNSIQQAIRPFMEDYLRLRFPGRFPVQAQIFEMANTIKEAGIGDPLAAFVDDLFALNEYTRPNMHGGGDSPLPGELRAHCRMVVSIIGSY